jgi:hypothetical protein
MFLVLTNSRNYALERVAMMAAQYPHAHRDAAVADHAFRPAPQRLSV